MTGRAAHRDPFQAPSAWIARFAPMIAVGGAVLDVAAGGGRHSRFLLSRGHPVTAVDRAVDALADLGGRGDIEILEADLEDGSPWPLAGRTFDAVAVANYLHRPVLPAIAASVAPGGLLLYETFASGHERFGRPRNPDFLLRPGELLDAVRDGFRVLAYEDRIVHEPAPAAVQRICARREA